MVICLFVEACQVSYSGLQLTKDFTLVELIPDLKTSIPLTWSIDANTSLASCTEHSIQTLHNLLVHLSINLWYSLINTPTLQCWFSRVMWSQAFSSLWCVTAHYPNCRSQRASFSSTHTVCTAYPHSHTLSHHSSRHLDLVLLKPSRSVVMSQPWATDC